MTDIVADNNPYHLLNRGVDQVDQGSDWPADCGFAGVFRGVSWAIGPAALTRRGAWLAGVEVVERVVE